MGRVSVLQDEVVVDVGCTILNIFTVLTCILKSGKMANFMLCALIILQ